MEKKYKYNNFVRKRVKNKCQVNVIVLVNNFTKKIMGT